MDDPCPHRTTYPSAACSEVRHRDCLQFRNILIITCRADSSKSSLGALALPVEIILMIFHELKNVEDALFLSIAHPTLEAIGATHLHALRLAEHAPWIGGRLVCVGDYADLDDLPAGMLSPIEREELETVLCRANHSSDDADEADTSNHPPTLYNFAQKTYTNVAHLTEGPPLSMALLSMCNLDMARCYGMYDAAFDADEWVLCNLSKQEYVLSRTIKDFIGEETKGPFCRGRIGFGTAILTRICWSSDSSTAMPYKLGLHRGEWAGDRFRVTTVDKFEETENTAEWTDVGAQVVAAIEEIWRSDDGEDWRNNIDLHRF
ncbi:hypothetical protein FA95DRAFT_1226092 [Auriscalpium vulgare]|uniref:Uncharacterized protein n=1 Tax=Auriscalpium vulgare TaxID=40419 RepID=A0ACB8RU03_9AGAM|nr:hypothetical protein FA95DRAFT_1226092 [Auriscalpium vulgare]